MHEYNVFCVKCMKNTCWCYTALYTHVSARSPTQFPQCSGVPLRLNIRRRRRFLEFGSYTFPSSLLCDAVLVLLLEVGLIAIRPHALSEQLPLRVMWGGQPISAAIRAAGRKSGGRYVRVSGVRVGEWYKQWKEKELVLIGGRES